MAMLIEFKVSNFRSIGEEQVLSLIPASSQKEYQDNIITDGKIEALNAIAVYGANGSGKSNLLRAIKHFESIVRKSSSTSSTSKLNYDPFLLREGWAVKPTSFELTFSLNELRYRYGFEYNESAILKEYLFRKAVGREVNVFQREGDVIDPSSTLKGNAKLIEAAIEGTRDNALFLSMMDTLNVEEASEVFTALGLIMYVHGNSVNHLGSLSTLWGDVMKPIVNKHLERFKLGLVGVRGEIEPYGYSSISDKETGYRVFAEHKVYDANGQPTGKLLSWDFMERESNGSINALGMTAPILYAISTGGILIIDEIEANMHPLITMDTINLFLNKETNPKDAQLIFATHDTNLLSYCELRRDQIYFAEKNKWESTEIYSLSDFVYVNETDGKESKERPDTDKEKRYIEGRYGAVPVLGPMAKLQSRKNG